MRAELVRIVSGPEGPAIGRQGPTGPAALGLLGPDGPMGAIGRHGATGLAGMAGVYAALMGATGKLGPASAFGAQGPRGSKGRFLLVPDDSYFAYGENISGYSGFTPLSVSAGCNFRYEVKGGENGSYLFAFFTAQFTDTVNKLFKCGIITGSGPGPAPGVFGGYPNNSVNASYTSILFPDGTNKKIPVFCSFMQRINTTTTLGDRWFDLAGISGTSSFDPNGGSLTNITATIFEVPV
jgi:hypothetical protein